MTNSIIKNIRHNDNNFIVAKNNGEKHEIIFIKIQPMIGYIKIQLMQHKHVNISKKKKERIYHSRLIEVERGKVGEIRNGEGDGRLE